MSNDTSQPNQTREVLEAVGQIVLSIATLGLNLIVQGGFAAARELNGKGFAFSGIAALGGLGLLYLLVVLNVYQGLISFLLNHPFEPKFPFEFAMYAGAAVFLGVVLGLIHDWRYPAPPIPPPSERTCGAHRQQVVDNIAATLARFEGKLAYLDILEKLKPEDLAGTAAKIRDQMAASKTSLLAAKDKLGEINSNVGLCQIHR